MVLLNRYWMEMEMQQTNTIINYRKMIKQTHLRHKPKQQQQQKHFSNWE